MSNHLSFNSINVRSLHAITPKMRARKLIFFRKREDPATTPPETKKKGTAEETSGTRTPTLTLNGRSQPLEMVRAPLITRIGRKLVGVLGPLHRLVSAFKNKIFFIINCLLIKYQLLLPGSIDLRGSILLVLLLKYTAVF